MTAPASGPNAAAWFSGQSFTSADREPAPATTHSAPEPTPLEDARSAVEAIRTATARTREVLHDTPRKVTADELRRYIDRVRNSLQALEGCAAALGDS